MAEIIWDSELGPAWPDDWEHTTVHAQFVAVTGDGADTDRLPDIAPSGNGEVLFTPSLRTVRYVGADGPYVVSLKQYRAVVDSEGYLCTPDAYGNPGERGIVLPSTDAEVLEPRGEDDNAFTWRVDFDLPAVTIRSDHIAVPVGGPYNLVDLLSPERAAGVVHIIDRVSAREAIEAASDAEAARDLVLPARDETLAARDETLQHGITVDTSVGTRVFVGDTMIHGDTGWRDIRDQMRNGWTADIFNIRRIDSTVYIQAGAVSNTGATSDVVLTLPSGFRTGSSNAQAMGIFQYSSLFTNTVLCGVRGGAGGSGFLIELGAETPSIGGQMSFATPNSWPTSLPGSPA